MTANAINELPAVLIAVDGLTAMSWGMCGWLLGANTGAVCVLGLERLVSC